MATEQVFTLFNSRKASATTHICKLGGRTALAQCGAYQAFRYRGYQEIGVVSCRECLAAHARRSGGAIR